MNNISVIEQRRFNHLEGWQWLLLIVVALIGIPVKIAIFSLDANPPMLSYQLGGHTGHLLFAVLAPYGLAWVVGRLLRRSRLAFLIVLWSLSLLILIGQVGRLGTEHAKTVASAI